MRGKIRYQNFRVEIPAGFTGLFEAKYIPDDRYTNIVGLAGFEDSTAEGVYYRVGLSSDIENYIDSVNKNAVMTSTQVAQNKKFMPVDVPTDNHLYIKVFVPAALVESIAFDLVFWLKKDECGC